MYFLILGTRKILLLRTAAPWPAPVWERFSLPVSWFSLSVLSRLGVLSRVPVFSPVRGAERPAPKCPAFHTGDVWIKLTQEAASAETDTLAVLCPPESRDKSPWRRVPSLHLQGRRHPLSPETGNSGPRSCVNKPPGLLLTFHPKPKPLPQVSSSHTYCFFVQRYKRWCVVTSLSLIFYELLCTWN